MVRMTGALAAVLVGATACASGHEDSVRTVADDYARAVLDQDWSAACVVLAPATREELEQSSGRPCPAALADEDPPAPEGVPAVQVYGTKAVAAYDGDTLFASQYDGRWLLVATACTAHDPRPYDCDVSGG